MENLNRQNIRDQVAQALKQIELTSTPASAGQEKYGPYHQAAAVLATFDHKQLKPVSEGSDPKEIDLLLANSRLVSQPGATSRWELLPEIRHEVLRQLGDWREWRHALEANPDRSVDETQKIFEAYMSGEAPPLEQQDIRQVAASLRVVDWLEGLVLGIPGEDSIRQRHDFLCLLQPFQELAGEHFRGRKSELQQLRDYVGVLPPGSIREQIKRKIAKVFEWKDQPPLMIYGPGGLGKSTLVARFIWEHATYAQAEQFPWIYIDFDRPGMYAENPPFLLLEGIRQLGIQYPQARQACDQIRTEWRSRLGRQNRGYSKMGSTSTTVARLRDWEPFLEDFANLLTNLKVEKDPLLLVLDTFEEVQYRGEGIVRHLLEFLQRLQRRVPRLRTTMAGRAPLDGFPEIPIHQLPLADFDSEAAQGFLEAHGVSPSEVAKSIAGQVGGNPLSLRLAVTVWLREGVNKSGQLDLKTRHMLGFRIRENEMQGLLFERILDHIHDPEVSKIAYPGLALRRITPELIQSVLAAPCEVTLSGEEDVQRLFNGLKQEVWLVSAEENSLRHRPDVRRIMIGLLREREPRKSHLIDEAAVKYYEQQTGPVARAEEIYHRLVLQQSEQVLNQRWYDDPELEERLYSAVDEFEMRERVWLKSRLPGISLSEEERAQADHEGWEREVAVRVEQYLEAGLAKDALALLGERGDKRIPGSYLYELEAQALEIQGKTDEAQQRIQRGLESALESGNVARALELQIHLARLASVTGQLSMATEALNQAEEIIRLRGEQDDRQIEVGLIRLAVLRQENSPPEQREEEQKKLRDTFTKLSDVEIVDSAELIGQLVGEIGENHPDVLWRSVRILGINSPRQGPLRKLASALTEWDRQLSQSANQVPGLLARSLQIPERGSLEESWDNYILESPPEQLEKMIPRLQEKYPVVPPAVRAAIAQLLAERVQPSTQIVSGQGVLPYEQLAVKELKLELKLNLVPGTPATAAGREQEGEPRSVSISLTSQQREDLVAALMNAFRLEELRAVLHYRLNISLDAITFRSNNLREIVQRLVQNAEKGGWLAQLLAAALESRPDNVQLQTLAARLGLATEIPDEESLIKTLHASESLFNVTEWRAELGRLETKICRIEISSDQGLHLATGFLVAPSLVLTAYHVMADVIDRKITPDRVLLRFDYRQLKEGNVISTGTVFQLEVDWLVDFSPFSKADQESGTPHLPGPEELDYALLRIAGEPGNQPVGGERAESNANRRGWIDVPLRIPELRPGTPLFILHHPEGRPLNLSLDMEGVVGLNGNGTRLHYTTSTMAGSAGAPCFNQNWELVAMHHAAVSVEGERAVNQGIPIAAILQLLEKRQLRQVLGAATPASNAWSNTADEGAIDLSQQAIREARQKGDRRAEAIELGRLGRATQRAMRTQEAIKLYDQALQIAREIHDPYMEAEQLGNLGNAHAELGQSQIPLDFFSQAIKILQMHGDKHGEMIQWINVGNLFLTLGEGQRAIDPYQHALELTSSVEDNTWQGIVLSGLGRAYSDPGAIRPYQKLLELASSLENVTWQAIVLNALGRVYTYLRDFQQAIGYYEQVLVIARELRQESVEEAALGELGNLYLRLQEPDRAIGYYREQLNLASKVEGPQEEPKILGRIGEGYEKMGDLQQAISYYQQQLSAAQVYDDALEQAQALNNLGSAMNQSKDSQQAIYYYERARSIWMRTGDIHGLALSTLNLATLYAAHGDLAHALSLAREAEDNLARIGSPMAQTAQRLLKDLQSGRAPQIN